MQNPREPRLRLAPPPQHGPIDGAWWPRPRENTAEARALVAAHLLVTPARPAPPVVSTAMAITGSGTDIPHPAAIVDTSRSSSETRSSAMRDEHLAEADQDGDTECGTPLVAPGILSDHGPTREPQGDLR